MPRHQPNAGKTTIIVLSLSLGLAVEGLAQASGGRGQQMEQALAERYRLTLVGPGALGLTGSRSTIRRAGNVVLLRREGLQGSLEPDQPASYSIRGEKAEAYRGRMDAPLEVGVNLYVHSIQVGSDVITLGVLTSHEASAPSGSGHLWAALSFFFPPDLVAGGDLSTIYRTLDYWLQPQGAFQPSLSDPGVAEASSSPKELKPGMSREEVIAALGPPRREVGFRQRTWLNYGSLVVVLEEGRLATVDRDAQPPGKVVIVSEPDGADVYIDGDFIGSTPATVELPPDNYQVSVRLGGYRDWNRGLRVLAGSEVTLRARLEQ